MPDLIELGKLDYNQRHGDSILLRFTHDLKALYVVLRCAVPDDERGIVPCPREVVGMLGLHAFCEHHERSASNIRLFANPGIYRIYRALKCSIPEHYDDCRHNVVGVYKDTAFCKPHAWAAMERRKSYPFHVN